MLSQWVRRLNLTSSSAAAQPVASTLAGAILRYPPADTGLPLLDPDGILAANEDLIKRLRLHAAVADSDFEGRFRQPLLRLASYINVLPATSSGLFSGEMGLFRAALECGFFSFQSSDGRIFTGSEGVERRHRLENRWRYLCFLAGLFYPTGKSLERLAVAAPGGEVWKRHFHGVTDWAHSIGGDRVFVSWGSTDDAAGLGPSSASAGILPSIVGSDNLQMLEDGAKDLIAALYQLAAGAPSSSRIAHQVVSGAWERIMDREAARRPQAFGKLVSGTHLGPYLIGAIRALVESGTWTPNNSHLHADKSGLYLRWPEAAQDLVAFGRAKGYAGWPDDPPTLAALLRAANIVKGEGNDIGTVEIVASDGEILQALPFVNPLSVLEDFDPADYAGTPAKTLDAVLAVDPLSQAEAALAAPPATSARSNHAEVAEDEVDEPAQADAAAALATSAPAPVAAADADKPGQLREAPDVRYADLVPEEIRADIGNALQVELLGKVVKAWRSRGENSDSMRRVDTGAAVSFKFLSTIMRDATTWVDNMAKVGLIYSPPSTPGLRILKVSMPEGRKNEVPAVVLSNLACKRLGL